VPTLVLYRQGGLPNQDEEAREVARRIPGASALLLSGSDYCEIFQSREAADEIERFVAGVRPAAIPESFLTTVMFTDLVGSTERAAAVGDRAWRELLASHHSLVRRELAHFRGEERDTAGDGFFATFDGPARAISAAHSIISGLDSLRRLRLGGLFRRLRPDGVVRPLPAAPRRVTTLSAGPVFRNDP
jgi:class 3 adenylate cyclase